MHRFYDPNVREGLNQLPEEEAKHCIQVLRQSEGDQVSIMDGKGGIHDSILTKVSKKQVEYESITSEIKQKKNFNIHLAIAPTKNTDRMEWLIEKLSEIGVDQVTFILTQNSERRKLRIDRLEKKAISAMKQSGNPYLIALNDLTPLDTLTKTDMNNVKLIAHVEKSHQYIDEYIDPDQNVTLLIGPEGDFTLDEIKLAQKNGFQTVSLGNRTLRTETAGFVACCFINFINKM